MEFCNKFRNELAETDFNSTLAYRRRRTPDKSKDYSMTRRPVFALCLRWLRESGAITTSAKCTSTTETRNRERILRRGWRCRLFNNCRLAAVAGSEKVAGGARGKRGKRCWKIGSRQRSKSRTTSAVVSCFNSLEGCRIRRLPRKCAVNFRKGLLSPWLSLFTAILHLTLWRVL